VSAWRAGVGRERPGGRGGERARGAEPDHQQEERQRRGGVGRHVHGDPDHHEGFGAERDRGQPPAVDAVGDGAGDEHEQGGGGELGETQEPEGELAVGHVEDELAQHGTEQRHRG
jgi:hypothetical protein